jgi:hypothetical protein
LVGPIERSILLTGAFGILGLLKEFKDKETGRITKWGGVSLVGILLSSILGVAAQLQTSWAEETGPAYFYKFP